jgi:folate-dependent phosphoribosylglycinamide formyltransferase PurN
MKPFGKNQFLILGCFTGLILLSGCGKAEPEVCGSLEIRNSIVKMIASDHNNALVDYAARKSSAVAAMVGDTNVEAEKLTILENAKRGAVYTLDDTILTKLRDRATHAVTCSGFLDVTVADTIAQKEVEFRVEQTTDGKLLVSVNPFLF